MAPFGANSRTNASTSKTGTPAGGDTPVRGTAGAQACVWRQQGARKAAVRLYNIADQATQEPGLPTTQAA